MMDTADIDEWLTHLQSEVDAVGDQLHRLVTALITIGVSAAMVAALAVMTVYALNNGAA